MQQVITLVLLLVLIAAQCVHSDDLVAGIDIGKDYEARVRSGIEQNRKSGAIIDIVSRSGAKVMGANVTVKQTSSDFLFGCAFPLWSEPPKSLGEAGWSDWNNYFTRVFNYATTENSFKWGPMEPVEGQVHWESTDFIVKWCRDHNIKLKGHNLVWATEDGTGTPGWVYKYPPSKVEELFKKRIAEVMGRYKSDIRIWDVVNEPVHLHNLEKAWRADYVAESFKLARAADPTATLILNDFSSFVGANQWIVPLAKNLVKKGVPIDVLAEQAHDPPYWYTPKDILGVLDEMAETGLRIHLTELTYPSDNQKITGFVQGKWDEQKQGEFYRYFMTLAFSHPSVDAVTVWNLWDGCTWLKHGGIIREDWTPKPAYAALDDLINNKWKTRFESRTDSNGQVRFHGFHGDYEVTVTAPDGRMTTAKTHLSRGSDAHVEITME